MSMYLIYCPLMYRADSVDRKQNDGHAIRHGLETSWSWWIPPRIQLLAEGTCRPNIELLQQQ